MATTQLLTLAGRSARDGRPELASPSRPSTHTLRVPTSFLALAYAECKNGAAGTGRPPPAFATSVKLAARSAPSVKLAARSGRAGRYRPARRPSTTTSVTRSASSPL